MDLVEVKKLAKELQFPQSKSTEDLIGILTLLKKNVVVSESLLRESKAGIAVGKLRQHEAKEVADFAKTLVKEWKTTVDKQKQVNGSSMSSKASSVEPIRKGSISQTPPVTPISAISPASFQGKIRTAKSDGVNLSVTRDKTRDKCIELIYDSLAFDTGAPSDLILKQASAIERNVLSEHDSSSSKEYKAKIRSLYLNLKDKSNPGLRERILTGRLDVAKFCKMTSQEMASEERQAADKQIQEQNLHNSLGAGELQAETEAFQCGRCKNRKCRYRQAQTRSADEPMTTFVTCVVCNHRWKFS